MAPKKYEILIESDDFIPKAIMAEIEKAVKDILKAHQYTGFQLYSINPGKEKTKD